MIQPVHAARPFVLWNGSTRKIPAELARGAGPRLRRTGAESGAEAKRQAAEQAPTALLEIPGMDSGKKLKRLWRRSRLRRRRSLAHGRFRAQHRCRAVE
ncbi:MAG: hypothetical protein HSCHL_1768 [Hydrogenibacillus schlegelii]|uniref:Uncharacterized protein n=1 Tax=Hydrogenibacillus schlegelii TaxID=1484 RepID=A0A2T5GF87_HYDSH|nr:MAG: hypothetical protein HSCHL_1768 [Hydrogenibacillus schlegelii]